MKNQEDNQHDVKEMKEKNDNPGKSNVDIELNSTSVSIHRGSYTVSDLKATLGVSADKELDQFVDGDFVPLNDDSRVVIKGGEVFISHVRAGGSS
ncbi:hypothetical protein [Methylotenera sp.]|uniref:hypothetical protein n=1 Tax=Methylotenera sp. TaxID=2051956 RepID=UPI002ED8CA11